MKLRVLAENPLSVMEYKKIVDLVKSSKSLKTDLLKTLPTRFKEVFYKANKLITIYLDKKDADAHKYELKFN